MLSIKPLKMAAYKLCRGFQPLGIIIESLPTGAHCGLLIDRRFHRLNFTFHHAIPCYFSGGRSECNERNPTNVRKRISTLKVSDNLRAMCSSPSATGILPRLLVGFRFAAPYAILFVAFSDEVRKSFFHVR